MACGWGRGAVGLKIECHSEKKRHNIPRVCRLFCSFYVSRFIPGRFVADSFHDGPRANTKSGILSNGAIGFLDLALVADEASFAGWRIDGSENTSRQPILCSCVPHFSFRRSSLVSYRLGVTLIIRSLSDR